jgi:hypothetical protein
VLLGVAFAAAGCTHEDKPGDDTLTVESVSAEVDENIATVVHVSWTTDVESGGYVEFGPDDTYGHRTPEVEAGVDHTATLLGLPAAATWHYRVVTESDGDATPGEDHEITTDPLPASLPPFEVERYGTGVWGEYLLLTWAYPEGPSAAVLILDHEGNVVWYHQPDEGMCMSARLSLDGQAVTMLVERTENKDARILRVPLDGGPVEETVVEGGHHDFLELGDDTWAWIADDTRTVDGVEVRGDRLMETGPAGDREVWDAFDQIPMVENDGWDLTPADWTHANGIDYDPDTGLFLLSLYRLRAIYAIRASDGGTEWSIGLGGDFTFVDHDMFGPQHAPTWVPGGILLFDNALDRPNSRVIQYALDMTAHTATNVWSYEGETGEHALVQGAALRLSDGGTVSGWGDLAEVVSVNADGDVVRRVTFDHGIVGKVSKAQDLYPDQ